MNLCRSDIMEMLEDAISDLYNDNWFFFTQGVGEWTISSEFHHIMKMKYGNRFIGFDMDAEYNLMRTIDHGIAQKMIVDDEGRALKIRPDFIIHRRGCPLGNVLCVEIKRHGGTRLNYDDKKLKCLTRTSDVKGLEGVHNYSFGVSVLMLKRRVECRWYEHGNVDVTRCAWVKVDHDIPLLHWQ